MALFLKLVVVWPYNISLLSESQCCFAPTYCYFCCFIAERVAQACKNGNAKEKPTNLEALILNLIFEWNSNA